MDFLNLFKPYLRKISIAFACLIIANIAALALPWSVKLILDDVFGSGNFMLLGQVLCVLVGIISLRAFAAYWGSYLGAQTAEKAAADLRGRLHHHLLKLPVLYVEHISSGELISKVIADVDTVKRFLLSGLLDFFYSLFNAFFILSILFFMDWPLATAAVFSVLIFVLAYSSLSKKFDTKYETLRKKHGELSGRLGEILRGIRTVHAFYRQDYEVERFAENQNQILKTAFQTHAIDARLWAATEFLSSLGLLLVLGLGARQVLMGRMSVGALMAFYAYVGFLFLPLMRLASIYGVYREARASMARIREVLGRWPEPVQAKKPFLFSKIKGDVEFKEVSFGYSDSKRTVEDVNLKVNAGETIALVGPSGSGKTTIISLLARFFDPHEGNIFVDGYDLRDLETENYRAKIAFVLQNDFLFNASIAQNILYGDLSADQKKVEKAAKAANIHDFIMDLPNQYETKLGEGGVNLSGGEKQRITIARAILRDPAILVLDEATSAVDLFSENHIAEAIQNLMKDRTTFIIAHRLSTVRRADRIVVMEKGKIMQIGRYSELFHAHAV